MSGLNPYLSDDSPTTLARNLVRRGTQHAKYQVGTARWQRPTFSDQGDTLDPEHGRLLLTALLGTNPGLTPICCKATTAP